MKKDADSHSLIFVTIEPSDMTNQEKKAYLMDTQGRRGVIQGNCKRRGKLKERPRLTLEVYFLSEKTTSSAVAEYH